MKNVKSKMTNTVSFSVAHSSHTEITDNEGSNRPTHFLDYGRKLSIWRKPAPTWKTSTDCQRLANI